MSNRNAHNLTGQTLPPDILKLLGLGSKMIPKPHCTAQSAWADFETAFTKLTRNIIVKYWFKFTAPEAIRAKKDKPWIPSKLHISDPDWWPDSDDIPAELSAMIDQVRKEVFPVIEAEITTFFSSGNADNLSVTERETLIKLQALHKDLVITDTDKNLGLAVLNKADYDAAVLATLSDEKTYRLQVEPSADILSRIFHEARSIFLDHLDFFSAEEKKFLFHHYSPRNEHNFSFSPMRLLPKVHKELLAYRAIVNAIRAITTPFSILINNRLQKCMQQQKSFIADSSTFVKLLEKLPIPRNRRHELICICTLDVVTLYPSVPVAHALDRLYPFLIKNNFEPHTSWVIVVILEFILMNNYVTFNEQVWKQIWGTAMGTAAAPCFASIFMSDLESPWLEEFDSIIHVFKRYLDDGILILYASEAEAKIMLDKFNLLNKHIQITYTISSSNAIFLDLDIYRDASFEDTGLFRTKTFFKPMNRFLYMPANSFHPQSCKFGFIRSEILRFRRLSSLESDFLTSVYLFFERLVARGYSMSLLENILSKFSFQDRAAALVPKMKSKQPKRFFFVTRLNPFSKSFNYSKLLNDAFSKFNTFDSFPISCSNAFSFPKNLPNTLLSNKK